jgi:hypothetical protein
LVDIFGSRFSAPMPMVPTIRHAIAVADIRSPKTPLVFSP